MSTTPRAAWRTRVALVACLLALAPLARARDAAEPVAGESSAGVEGAKSACFSPDGKWIFFGLRGDIWRVPADGGEATRMTLHEANDVRPRVSPDGKWLAFSSRRSGNYDIFIMPVEGGAPRQLTFHEATDVISDWSPDGSTILFYSDREGSFDLYTMPAEGGTPRRLTFDGAVQGRFSPDGRRVVYARGAVALTIKEYRGSSNYDIWTVPVEGGTPTRLTSSPWNERDPTWSKDGDAIFYCAEDDHHYSIWRIPSEGGTAEKIVPCPDGDAIGLSISPDGKELLFQKNFRLHRLSLETKAVKDVPIRIRSDVKGWTTETRKLTSGAKNPSFSPDGQQVAFSLRGDIWVMGAAGGPARRVTSGMVSAEWPRFSPDGKRIAFNSNQHGNSDIYVVPTGGGKAQQITTAKANDFYHSWSPDGKWLVYTSESSGNRDIWKIASDGAGEPVQLTKDPAPDDDACFSPDGEWIAFDSGRGGSQAIWVMKPDGSQARQVTPGGTTDQVPSWSADGKLLAFESDRNGRRGIWVIAPHGGPEMQVAADGTTPHWSPAGDKIVFEGGASGVQQVPAPRQILSGSEIPFIADVEIDRKDEWKRVFEEAWLAIKDGFYDPKLHGVDWDAVKKKYAPLVAEVEIKDDLIELIDQMLGELKASHMGIWADHTDGPHVATGYLGVQLAPAEALEGGPGMLVTDVVTGGPADLVWIRRGDRIFAIDDKPLDAKSNVYELLLNKVGHNVKVEVGTQADRRAARTLTIRPLSRGQMHELEYATWVKRREQRVADRGKTKIGYIHLNAMDQPNLQRFTAALNGPMKDRAALVIDVRNNGGGNIHQQLLDILARRPYVYFDPRSGDRSLQETPVWAKPVCVMCNERSYSDAEIFPYGFKTLGLGKVIGAPTSGGVIGTGSRTLCDGSTLRMPYVGWYGLDGKNLERWGIEPDIIVEETADDRAHDRDPQVDRAIDEMMLAIGEKPVPAAPPAETGTKGAESKRSGPY